MKVLVLATTFPRWEGDTTPAFVYELSRRLNKKPGIELIVLAPHHPGAKKFEIMDGLKVYRFPYFWPKKYQKLCYEGGILPNIKRSFLAKIQVPLLILTELYWTQKIIKKEKIDTIHSHWVIPSGLVGAIYKKIMRIKHIMTIHAGGIFSLEKLPLKKNIADFIMNFSDKITVVSSYIGERLFNLVPKKSRKRIKNKTKTISMGVDTKIYKPNKNKEKLKRRYGIKRKNILLSIGRLSEKKGLKYLIKAMPEIVSKKPNTKLIICGSGPLEKNLKELTKKLDLKNHIDFSGYVSEEEKIDYLSLSDILIVPSIVTKSGNTEGLPVVILEGLASGKPIIASDVSGIKDAIKNGFNGFLIEEKKPNRIVEKVLKLLENKKLRKKFSKKALETSKKYSWDKIADKTLKLYEELE